jgi:uncharacterized protein YkwD
MLVAVNAARATGRSCGTAGFFAAAGPLSWSPALAAAAQGHSDTMAMTSCFAHDATGSTPCSDGNPCIRISAQGYDWSGWGENIAAGQLSVADVMAAWLASPHHCANLMNPDFTDFGAGVALGGAYGIYWTQNFGTLGGCSSGCC